jgi:two-component system, OmpR family, response regulator
MKKVLIIDDTKNIRIMLKKCLELEGYEVTTANDGQQALDLFKTEEYDLAFLDIKMPGIRGTEVLRRIRGIGITTPVIIITAFGTVKNAVDCTNMGAVAYIQKPFSAEKITTLLRELDFNNPGVQSDQKIENQIKQIEMLINQNLFNKAEALVKKAIATNATNADLYLLYSRVFNGLGDKDNASKFQSIYRILIGDSNYQS